MTTPFTSQIQSIENIFPEMEEKPMLFECEMQNLKQQVRNFCKEKGYYNQTQLKSESGRIS